jgi:hypothetical protein
MCGRCLLIGLIALVACCSPTLADTLNSSRNAPGLKRGLRLRGRKLRDAHVGKFLRASRQYAA